MKNKAAALSLAMLCSTMNSVRAEMPEEVDLKEEAVVQEEVAPAPEAIALTYENIDLLTEKNNGLHFTVTWMKGEEVDAEQWKDMLGKIMDAYHKDTEAASFADALELINSFDAKIQCQGNLNLTLEPLNKDNQLKRTKKDDINFDEIVEKSAGLQFIVQVNSDDYTSADWKRIMTRIVELAEMANSDKAAALSAKDVLESLNEVECKN